MSIGDSALDYFKENEIKSKKKTTYPSDDKFYAVEFSSKYDIYEKVGFHVKKNDKRFIMHEIAGRTFIEFNKCLEKKRIAIKEIKEILPKVSVKTYNSDYRKKFGKSFAEVTDLKLEKGEIRIYCDNWEEKYIKEHGWDDSFNISLNTNKFLNWINNEAY